PLRVTGSVTSLSAASFSDNSWMEENNRRDSLKPHAKAESFRGLLSFSVSRQNCDVTGSLEDLPIQRRTMSPVHSRDGTTFPHALCSDRGPRVRPPTEVPYFFTGTDFPHSVGFTDAPFAPHS